MVLGNQKTSPCCGKA